MAETDSPEFQKALAPETLPDSSTGGSIKKRRGMTGGVRAILLISVMAVGVLGFMLMPRNSNDPATASSVGLPPAIDTTAAGETQATNPRYAQAVREYQEEQARLALEEGESFIPSPESILVPETNESDRLEVTTRTEPVQPAPVPRRVETTRVVASPAPVPEVRPRPVVAEAPRPVNNGQGGGQAGEEPPNPYLQAMTGQMQMISAAMVPPKPKAEDFEAQAEQAEMDRAAAQAQISGMPAPQAPGTAAGAPVSGLPAPGVMPGEAEGELPQGEIIVQAGDILYAQVVTDAVSDFVTPVVAEITVGEHKGARLVGAFEIDPSTDRMMVGFTQMTWPDGTARTVSALAVDGDTGETAVRSGIERRYFKRYAPIFAASFLNGLAAGASEPDKTIISDSDGNQSAVEEPRTLEESAWAGVSEATGEITADIRARMPKGPKIKLARGYPIGIMFAQDLREEEDE